MIQDAVPGSSRYKGKPYVLLALLLGFGSVLMISLPSGGYTEQAAIAMDTNSFTRSIQSMRPSISALEAPRGQWMKPRHRMQSLTRAHAKESRPSPLSMVKTVAAAAALSFLLSDPSGAAVATAPAPPDTSTVELASMYQADGRLRMLQMIGSWDTDKDGRISRPEFEKGMRDYVPHELSPGQMDQAWGRIVKAELQRRATDPSFIGNTLTDEQKQLPQPGQPFPLPTERVVSPIPKASGGFWKFPSPQQAYNAMVRKGKVPDINRAQDFVSTHNEMNERGWNQVLKYESVTHPECPATEVKLKKFNGDYPGRVEGSFDRHHWVVDRCGKGEATYVLDYFDTKKYDEITMPYSNDDIEIRVRPDPDDPNAKTDTVKFEKAMGKPFTTTADA